MTQQWNFYYMYANFVDKRKSHNLKKEEAMLLLIKISYVKLTFILITNYVVCYKNSFVFNRLILVLNWCSLLN